MYQRDNSRALNRLPGALSGMILLTIGSRRYGNSAISWPKGAPSGYNADGALIYCRGVYGAVWSSMEQCEGVGATSIATKGLLRLRRHGASDTLAHGLMTTRAIDVLPGASLPRECITPVTTITTITHANPSGVGRPAHAVWCCRHAAAAP